MTLEEIRTYTPWALAILGLLWAVLLYVINKTFATKKEVGELRTRHQRLESKVEDLPSHKEVAALQLNMEKLNGQIEGLRPQLQSLQRMSDLLIENELNGK